MSVDLALVQKRYYDAVVRRGVAFVLRRIVQDPVSGMNNPPVAVGAVLNGAVAPSALTLSVRANSAFGALLNGDKLTVGTEIVTVSGANPSSPAGTDPPGFPTVSLVTGFQNAWPDGAPITFSFVNDLSCIGTPPGTPTQLVNGELVVSRTVRTTIPAYNLPVPQVGWQLVFADDVRNIVAVTPLYAMGIIGAYQVFAE